MTWPAAPQNLRRGVRSTCLSAFLRCKRRTKDHRSLPARRSGQVSAKSRRARATRRTLNSAPSLTRKCERCAFHRHHRESTCPKLPGRTIIQTASRSGGDLELKVLTLRWGRVSHSCQSLGASLGSQSIILRHCSHHVQSIHRKDFSPSCLGGC